MTAMKHPSYTAWQKAYGDYYQALPSRPDSECPNCGHRTLRLEFVAAADERIGWAAFWCDTCMLGITTSRTHVPTGVPFHPIGTPWPKLQEFIPDFVMVEPTGEDGNLR